MLKRDVEIENDADISLASIKKRHIVFSHLVKESRKLCFEIIKYSPSKQEIYFHVHYKLSNMCQWSFEHIQESLHFGYKVRNIIIHNIGHAMRFD